MADSADLYTIEAVEDVRRVCGVRTEAFLRRSAAIVFKPDGLVRRSVGPALAILREHGFVPAASSAFVFNRNIVREMWRDNGWIPPADFRELVDRFIAVGPSLYVMLRLDGDQDADASTRLRDLKGPSPVQRRQPWHLRARLGGSSLLNYVHTPDGPSAFLKELGMLFGAVDRRALLAEAASGTPAGALETPVRALYSGYPEHDLSLTAAVERLSAAAPAHGSLDREGRRLRSACERLLAGGDVEWNALEALVASLGIRVAFWDGIVLAAACLEPGLLQDVTRSPRAVGEAGT
jgi:nucleoside diphosphate kinase